MRLRTSLWLLGTAAVFSLLPAIALPDGLTFTGNLERVGDQSISIQLPDRRVIDAMLGYTSDLDPSALAGRFRMGDEVEITCKSTRPVWEPATSRFQSLEVTAIRFIRRPSPEDVANLLEAKAREGKNLLQRPSVPLSARNLSVDLDAPGGKALEHARQVNLHAAANMPNFVADEIAKRYRSSRESSSWLPFDTVESEIAFRGQRVSRQQIRRNGKPWNSPFDALPGFKWYEGFETEISPLLDPHCPTSIDYQDQVTVAGRPLLKYGFRSPVDGCFPYLYFTYQRYNPARSGQFFIEASTGSVMQVDDTANDFPSDFEFADRQEHMFWDYVKIGDASHLLPVRANFLVTYASGERYRVEVEYTNHRHFEASTNLTFH